MKSEWAKRISQVSVFNVEKVRQKIWRWKLRSDLQLFSTCLWNSRKSPEGPLLRDLGSDKDSLCSASKKRGASCLHTPSSAGVLQGLLCGTCGHMGAVSRSTQGFALCHAALAPSSNTSALVTQERAAGHLQILRPSAGLDCRLWGSQGWVLHSGQGKELWESSTKCSSSVQGCKVNKAASPVAPSACLFLVGVTAGIPQHYTLK